MLADPELDLLRELLEEDPGAGVFLDVARELVRRGDEDGAIRVLERGLVFAPKRADGWQLLMDVSTAKGWPGRTAMVMDKVDPKVFEAAGLPGIYAEAMLRAGREPGEAGAAAYVELMPGESGVELIGDAQRPMSDPLLSPKRAEAYCAVGRPDRAVRVYRRLVFHHPDHDQYAMRLAELLERDFDHIGDEDLSEELPSPALAPDLQVPRPTFALGSDEDATQPDPMNAATVAPARERQAVFADDEMSQRPFVYGMPEDDEVLDEEDPTVACVHGLESDPADLEPGDMARRRRRSLLRR